MNEELVMFNNSVNFCKFGKAYCLLKHYNPDEVCNKSVFIYFKRFTVMCLLKKCSFEREKSVYENCR